MAFLFFTTHATIIIITLGLLPYYLVCEFGSMDWFHRSLNCVYCYRLIFIKPLWYPSPGVIRLLSHLITLCPATRSSGQNLDTNELTEVWASVLDCWSHAAV